MFAAQSYEAFGDQLKAKGPWRLFCWMCLIFMKTHLKDNNLRFHQDQRKGPEKIGEMHSWEEMHHIHCMARSFYTQCELKVEALGSLLILPAKLLPYGENFDYCDLSFAQTMLLRIDEIAIVVVFDDSQGALSLVQDMINKVTGPLSPIQLREVAVRLAIANIYMAQRPIFRSEVDIIQESYAIGGIRPPELKVGTVDEKAIGKMMGAHMRAIPPTKPRPAGDSGRSRDRSILFSIQ